MVDPIDWAAWCYGKIGHWGLVLFAIVMFIGIGMIWLRGVERYQEQHPQSSSKHVGQYALKSSESAEHVRSQLAAIQDGGYRTFVADVIHAFEPRSHITVGGAVIGPDGGRIVDIQVWPAAGGSGPIAMDVIDKPDGTPVGINVIDEAESKRRDIKATAMLVCSKTGFDSAALTKAKRTKIGLISAIKQGNDQLTGRIEEEIYLRKIDLGNLDITYDGLTSSDGARLRALKDYKSVKHSGTPIVQWLEMRVTQLLQANAMSPILFATLKSDERITATFNFKRPTVFKCMC